MFDDIYELNKSILLLIQHIALKDTDLASFLFGLPQELSVIFRELTLKDIENISQVKLPLFELRYPHDTQYWQRIIELAKEDMDQDSKISQMATILRIVDKEENSV